MTCKPAPAIERFWQNVEKTDDCWLWKGSKTNSGYGRMGVNRKNISAHRFSFLLHKGEIDSGLVICHKCDVPLCVNPDHLFLGTHADNIADRDAKGRSAKGLRNPAHLYPEKRPKGETQGLSKLTTEKVLEARTRRARGEKLCDLAKEFGISPSTMSSAILGKTWKHI